MECLVLSGIHVPDDGLNAIWDVAMNLIANNKNEGRVKHLTLEGVVRTEGKIKGIGDMYGYYAEAEVDSEFGSGTLTFIIRIPRNGEKVHWMREQKFGDTTLN